MIEKYSKYFSVMIGAFLGFILYLVDKHVLHQVIQDDIMYKQVTEYFFFLFILSCVIMLLTQLPYRLLNFLQYVFPLMPLFLVYYFKTLDTLYAQEGSDQEPNDETTTKQKILRVVIVVSIVVAIIWFFSGNSGGGSSGSGGGSSGNTQNPPVLSIELDEGSLKTAKEYIKNAFSKTGESIKNAGKTVKNFFESFFWDVPQEKHIEPKSSTETLLDEKSTAHIEQKSKSSTETFLDEKSTAHLNRSHIPPEVPLDTLPRKVLYNDFVIPPEPVFKKMMEPDVDRFVTALSRHNELTTFINENPNAEALSDAVQWNMQSVKMLSHQCGWIETYSNNDPTYLYIINSNKNSANESFAAASAIIEEAIEKGELHEAASKTLYSFIKHFR